ncbi:MAG: DNA methyltransferase [Armatimonadota bacterium]
MRISLQSAVRCPVCQEDVEGNLGKHIQQVHGEQAYTRAVLDARQAGMSDAEIGARFGITLKQLERLVLQAHGINVSPLPQQAQVKSWFPKDFKPETTTVWSYKQRGNWATHNGRYRGNWSPYIPRNLILRYSQPGEVVLDPFVGGGTTAVEAKLLGRKCIAVDVNPACVELTRQSLRFNPPKTLFSELPLYEPMVQVGDARNLESIASDSIDLICAHPPYAGIIEYSPQIEGDLSQLGVDEYVHQMQMVAEECYRVLKPGRYCAVLIGDTRKHKHVVPIGFRVIDAFLRAGFRLKELVIKRQHNCKTTGFWRERSIQHNFLLLAHEYLPVFEKPADVDLAGEAQTLFGFSRVQSLDSAPATEDMETTTVWVLPSEGFERHIASNVTSRYGTDILFVQAELRNIAANRITGVDNSVRDIAETVDAWLSRPEHGKFVVIQTKDVRTGRYLLPMGKILTDAFQHDKRLWLKEIVIAVPDNPALPADESPDNLAIVHKYILVYEVRDDEKDYRIR